MWYFELTSNENLNEGFDAKGDPNLTQDTLNKKGNSLPKIQNSAQTHRFFFSVTIIFNTYIVL